MKIILNSKAGEICNWDKLSEFIDDLKRGFVTLQDGDTITIHEDNPQDEE